MRPIARFVASATLVILLITPNPLGLRPAQASTSLTVIQPSSVAIGATVLAVGLGTLYLTAAPVVADFALSATGKLIRDGFLASKFPLRTVADIIAGAPASEQIVGKPVSIVTDFASLVNLAKSDPVTYPVLNSVIKSVTTPDTYTVNGTAYPYIDAPSGNTYVSTGYSSLQSLPAIAINWHLSSQLIIIINGYTGTPITTGGTADNPSLHPGLVPYQVCISSSNGLGEYWKMNPLTSIWTRDYTQYTYSWSPYNAANFHPGQLNPTLQQIWNAITSIPSALAEIDSIFNNHSPTLPQNFTPGQVPSPTSIPYSPTDPPIYYPTEPTDPPHVDTQPITEITQDDFNNYITNNNNQVNNYYNTQIQNIAAANPADATAQIDALKSQATTDTNQTYSPSGLSSPYTLPDVDFGQRLHQFFTSAKTSSLFGLPAAVFSVPSGGTSTITINGGQTFGTTIIDLADWSASWAILKTIVMCGFCFFAVRIVCLKGGSSE